jgi:two-component system response regulator YesN
MWEYFFKIRTLDELEFSLISYIERYYNVLEERNSNNKIINIVITYIRENYHHEDLSITKISDYIHLAPTYLCSLFKEKTGKTLNQYITETRVEKSKELLLNTKYKISDVTCMVGLRDQGYFTKVFRKTTGMTPKEYIISK